jgi:hypothetical protein
MATKKDTADTQSTEMSEARQAFLAGEMFWRDYCVAENESHAQPQENAQT